MDRSNESTVIFDDWQAFLGSQAWDRFVRERVFGVDGYYKSIEKTVHAAVRDGNIIRANYHEGMCDGIKGLLSIMQQYHKELEA